MKNLTSLLKITFRVVSSGYKKVVLLLAIKNGKKRVILSILYMFYIQKLCVNLTNFA